MILDLLHNYCRNCGDLAYSHLKFPERMNNYNASIKSYTVNIDLKELTYFSNNLGKNGLFCSQFVPRDNLEYLEYLYEKRRKHK